MDVHLYECFIVRSAPLGYEQASERRHDENLFLKIDLTEYWEGPLHCYQRSSWWHLRDRHMDGRTNNTSLLCKESPWGLLHARSLHQLQQLPRAGYQQVLRPARL